MSETSLDVPPQTVHSSHSLGRIVQCASYGGPYAGSFVPMLAATAQASRRAGYETTICFSPAARGREWLPELERVAEIRILDGTALAAARELISIVDATLPGRTLFHSHFGQFDLPTGLAALARRRAAVVWHWHSAANRPARLRSQLLGAAAGRRIDAILCVGPGVYDEALARRFPRRKLHLVPNAIDTTRFGPVSEADRERARAQLGIEPGERVVLQFAWHWQVKGGDRLLAIAAEMAAEPGLRFLIVVGEGPADSPREEIARHPNVTPLAPRNDVETLFAAADVFLSASRTEGGMPYAVLEALSGGLPVVATDLPGQREALDGLPGARVVTASTAEFTHALRAVLALGPDERAAHADRARRRVVESSGLGPWAERLMATYSEVLSGRPGG